MLFYLVSEKIAIQFAVILHEIRLAIAVVVKVMNEHRRATANRSVQSLKKPSLIVIMA